MYIYGMVVGCPIGLDVLLGPSSPEQINHMNSISVRMYIKLL